MAAAAALEAVAPLGALWGLVQDFVMGQQEGPADQVAADVKSGSYTVLQVVEALGSSLENPEPRTRARGIQLLSQVLLQCHCLLLEKEVVHLILFYENRLKDHHLVIPSVLQGLRALSLCVALPPGLAVSVLKAIFQEVHVQSLPQVDRHTVYSIITNFMRTREEELKGLGADFTFGFIQVMDGEKDPRNLLVAFRIVYDLISRDYSLGPFVEELFEVTSCYFPIDFTPPPNDPHGIQREDLILSLRAVLASTPRFAEFLLPLLIEKVDSEILSAKLDSLQTLNACCAVYGQKELKDFLPSLWASIRREVFQTASERVEAEGLAALNSLTACLSRSVLRADAEDLLDSFLSNILQDCRHHLCEPDMKLVWPSAKLLQAAAGASARACDHITSNVLPLLLEQFHKHSQSNQRRTILEMILGFLKLQQKWSYEDKDERPLSGFKDQLCSLIFMALSDPNTQLQLVGIRTLTVLGAQPEKEHSVLKKVLLEDEVLATMVSVIATATTHLSPDLATQSVAHVVPLFLDGNISFLPENSFSGRFQPFQDGSSGQRRLVALLMAFVCSLPRNVEIPQLNRLMRELLELSCCQSCPFSSTAAAKCFAGLLNKHPAGQQLDEFLQLAVDKVEAGLSSGPCRSQAFTLLLWVTKALVLRYHPLSSCLTDRLMGLLSDPELGPAAADGFSLLMSDCTDVLTRAGHAEVRIMFRQRFFTDNVPALVRGFHAAPQDVKPNYLKGLSHVLNRLPKPVLLPELPTLLSLLLEALSCPDSVVQLSTLSCLQPLLLEAPQVMSLHVDTLVTKFLNLSASPSMAVRIAALQCMHALTHLPTPVLLPYKPQVIRALAKPLDDKKRLVRKEAVSARGEW
ncbi:hypothetical protein G4228_010461 [Cervus hanglu yarkandensis]|nr:hypothetical protein G4228_010461 [Cervus hanglu yarkandensis]